MGFIWLSILIGFKHQRVDERRFTRVSSADNIYFGEVLPFRVFFLDFLQNFQYFLHACGLFCAKQANIELDFFIKLRHDLVLHPFLDSVNLEPTWQGINLVTDNDEPLLFHVDIIIDFLDLAAFKVSYVDNFDDNRLIVHLFE
jgi:hypothetical protein